MSGLCGPAACVAWWGPCRERIHRHNRRLCNHASRGSVGWCAPGHVSGWRVRSRALRLMAMSARMSFVKSSGPTCLHELWPHRDAAVVGGGRSWRGSELALYPASAVN
jgi:hypothetical protein